MRVRYKKLMTEAKNSLEKEHYSQLVYSIKILLNSLYGAFGNAFFRYSNYDSAKSITSTGRYMIQIVGQKLDEYLNKVLKNKGYKKYWIYTDTDSVYISLDDIVKLKSIKEKRDISVKEKIDTLNKWSQNYLEKEIDKIIEKYIIKQFNFQRNTLKMSREVIADKLMLIKKKKYILSIIDNEGKLYLEKPKIKMKGIELIKVLTPDRKSTRLNSSHTDISRMPSSA